MMEGVRLDPRPQGGVVVDDIEDDRGIHCGLHRGAAGLTLTLPGMAVAEAEHRPGEVDAEVAGGTGADLRGVHVPAPRAGSQ
nr:hypothetical protein [Corynebacterium variabile]